MGEVCEELRKRRMDICKKKGREDNECGFWA